MSAGAQNQANPEQRAGAFSVEAGGDRIGGKLFIVGDYVWVKISSRDTNGAFAVLESYGPPLAGPPMHLHHNQDEWFYILEGQYLFEVDGRRFEAGPALPCSRRAGHGTRFKISELRRGARGGHRCTGRPGHLLRRTKRHASTRRRTDPATLVPLFQKYGLELLGPPLGAR